MNKDFCLTDGVSIAYRNVNGKDVRISDAVAVVTKYDPNLSKAMKDMEDGIGSKIILNGYFAHTSDYEPDCNKPKELVNYQEGITERAMFNFIKLYDDVKDINVNGAAFLNIDSMSLFYFDLRKSLGCASTNTTRFPKLEDNGEYTWLSGKELENWYNETCEKIEDFLMCYCNNVWFVAGVLENRCGFGVIPKDPPVNIGTVGLVF